MKTHKISSIIFDMDGVLWKENSQIADISKVFRILEQYSISYVFATNNSTKSPLDYVTKINGFGGKSSINQIVTSATVLAKKMSEKYPKGGPVYIVGEPGLHEILEGYGFYHKNSNVLAVAGGLNRKVTYQQLAKATLLLNSGADFFFTNIDPSYPSTSGDIPGAGAILSFLETASGKKALTFGKPKPYMFEEALRILNVDHSHTIVVGDRLETDILGGLNAKCHTALLLSGISTLQNIDETHIQPDLVCADLDTFIITMTTNNWEMHE
ncbi:MAG: hypothetical protein CVU46_04600 [Chloroflexi bacterium HGW-Chloroflexi-8]|nr:MAG: hypothetical protein CVU46_04600 [Chloroflexi bacterium HGW-Chloroflexi-8]